ncbi:MAG: SDR family NAD(P)-dependent oxidoreductase [Gemmataceae bacterium]|nr:SDR family NAD(P)-dependent oxidoreductase [Gemmataceae bacterium]
MSGSVEGVDRMGFEGKVVYITGASSGIGLALAKEFALRGARLGILARREDRLRQLCGEIRATGGTIEYAVADAADRGGMNTAVASLNDRLGLCDVMIANAGIGASNTSTDLNVTAAEQVIRTNLLGPMYAFEAVFADLLARGSGHLVAVSSVAAFKGLPTSAAYCASKAGLNAYLESIRISLRARNIAVTAICPGFVRTEMTEKSKKMLWACNADVAARKIARAIQRQKKVYVFPTRMGLLVKSTRWLPDWLVAKALPDDSVFG